jgi:inhibitor of cysteine peptidase
LQREIKNKTLTYGVAALLLAVILTATVYNFGIQPTMTPGPNAPPDFEAPPQTEEPPTTEAPMTGEPTEEQPTSDSTPEPIPEVPQLGTFSSYEELESFLTEGMKKAIQSENLALFNVQVDGERVTTQDASPPVPAPAAGVYSMNSEYSTTNVQVAGVDEADIVKSDGEYLYIISGQAIYILKAYPPDQAEVLSKIEVDETYDAQIYVNENKLVVLGSLSPYITYGFAEVTRGELWINPSVYNEEVFLRVYDITNREAPVLSRTVTLNGTLSGSRMIGDYVYAVVRQVATQTSSNGTGVEAVLPTISGDYAKEVKPTEIRYVDIPDVYYYMTTVVAVDVRNDSVEPTSETFLTGQTTTMYVSLNNMYLVVPNTNVWILSVDGEEPREDTMIFRIALNEEKVVAMAEGTVSGNVLNQFSMDEYNGYFRVATTTNEWWGDGVSKNHLYILNMSLKIVGEINEEDLAPGERIYSTRFMGDRCYMVTFRQIDPFFVIDVATPTEPKVLGYLKIPGFSGYLHQYDENHVIGIGKEDNNVKLSLFDVTDVTAPTELAKYIVQADYSDSPVLYDHKALLFDKQKQLLAIPVSTNIYGIRDGNTGYWQGAYVFNISLEQGFTHEGNITHQNFNSQYDYDLQVRRILYIGNDISNVVLYTVSNSKVKMNDLESLETLNEINLS